jgi:hypothetical protein
MNGKRVKTGSPLRHFIPPKERDWKSVAIIRQHKRNCKGENAHRATGLE